MKFGRNQPRSQPIVQVARLEAIAADQKLKDEVRAPIALAAGLVAELGPLTDQLPQKERAAVVLRYGFDLPYDEIAAALGSSEDAARQAASSGVRRLRERSNKS